MTGSNNIHATLVGAAAIIHCACTAVTEVHLESHRSSVPISEITEADTNLPSDDSSTNTEDAPRPNDQPLPQNEGDTEGDTEGDGEKSEPSPNADETPSPRPSPELAQVNNRLFNDAAIIGGQAMATIDLIDLIADGDDGMTYDCRYDRSFDGSVDADDLCTELPGTATFVAESGIFNWTPPADVDDIYEFKFTGTNETGASETIVAIRARPSYTTTGQMLDLDARVPSTSGYPIGSLGVWANLTELANPTVLGAAADSWLGTGTVADPYHLALDGTSGSRVNLRSILDGATSLTFSAWLRPQGVNAAKTVIAIVGEGQGDGFLIQQSGAAPGQLEFGTGSYAGAVKDLAPISFWRLNEAAGATAVDELSYQDGTYNGTGHGQTGPLAMDDSASYQISSTSDFVLIPDQTNYRSTSLTIALWFNWDGNATLDRPLISKNIGSTWNTSYMLWLENSGSGAIAGWLGDSGGYDSHITSTVPSSGTWHHAAFTYDGTTMRFYLNGSLVDSHNSGFTPSFDTNPILIGGYDSTNDDIPEDFFDGKIADVAFWNQKLETEDILALYQSSQPCRSTTVLADDTWYHVAATYDGAEAKLYIDGLLECTQAQTAPILDTSDDILLGGSSMDGRRWHGDLGQVRAWSDTLDQPTIQSLFDNFKCRYEICP